MRSHVLFEMSLFVFSMPAQDLRSVQGIVSDEHRRPLPGAVVEIQDRKTLQIRFFVTQGDGEYHFSELNSDRDYTLTARYHKIWSGKKHLSQFNSRKNAVLNLRVPVRRD